ncbi:MAG: RNA polymerase sigma factor [Flavobacteriaceae bacterium]
MSDQELIQKLKDPNHSNGAFRYLIRNYQERLYWHIRKIVLKHEDADDIVQEVFIKVFKNIDKFKGESSIYSWMYRIATNESLSFLKRDARMKKLPFEEYMYDKASALQSDVLYDGDQIQLMLHKALAKLPEQQRLIFTMKYLEDLSYKEISVLLDKTQGGLKANYFHAVSKIKEYFKSNDWLDQVEELKMEAV